MRGIILQLSISPGGLPKSAILSGDVGPLGIRGDAHRYRGHGGPRKALLLMTAETIDELCAEGWPVFYGALGENLTTRGLDRRAWRVGQRFRAGSVMLELTEPREPCRTLAPYGAGLAKRIYDWQVKAGNPASPHWGLSGFYAAVRKPGIIQLNDIIESVDHVV